MRTVLLSVLGLVILAGCSSSLCEKNPNDPSCRANYNQGQQRQAPRYPQTYNPGNNYDPNGDQGYDDPYSQGGYGDPYGGGY